MEFYAFLRKGFFSESTRGVQDNSFDGIAYLGHENIAVKITVNKFLLTRAFQSKKELYYKGHVLFVKQRATSVLILYFLT